MPKLIIPDCGCEIHLLEELRQRLEIGTRHRSIMILQFDVEVLTALTHTGEPAGSPRRWTTFLGRLEAREAVSLTGAGRRRGNG